MNIFVTDPDPVLSAVALDDRRLGKLIIESAQLLATALNTRGFEHVYRITHQNHPCSRWLRESDGNLVWLLAHACGLALEYERRFGRSHRSYVVGVKPYLDTPLTGDREVTPFARCMRNTSQGYDFTHVEDTCDGYRQYLSAKWDDSAPRWTNASPPPWYVGVHASSRIA